MRSGAGAQATRCVSISLDGPERPNPSATGQGQKAKGRKPLSGLAPRQ